MAWRRRTASRDPTVESRAMSGRSLTRELGRTRGMVYAWSYLCDVGLDRIDPERRRLNSSEAECVGRGRQGSLPQYRISETNVDAKREPVWFSGKSALGAESHSLIPHAVALDLGMAGVGSDLKAHEVAEVEAACALKHSNQVVRGPEEAQIDVFGGAGSGQPQLENKPTLERYRVTEQMDNTGQESVEHQKLALSSEAHT
jgi:hypothetical protein